LPPQIKGVGRACCAKEWARGACYHSGLAASLTPARLLLRLQGLVFNVKVPKDAFVRAAHTDDTNVDLRTADAVTVVADDIEWHKLGFVGSVLLPKATFARAARVSPPKRFELVDDAVDWHKMGLVSSFKMPFKMPKTAAPTRTSLPARSRPKRVNLAPPGIGDAVDSLMYKKKERLKVREARFAQAAAGASRSPIEVGPAEKRFRGDRGEPDP